MSPDSYHQYAADCMRLAERENSPEAKAVMMSMARAWVQLGQLKQSAGLPAVVITPDTPPEVTPDAVIPVAVATDLPRPH